MNKIISILFVLVISILITYAQDIEEWVETKKSVLYEKLFLHVDRHYYSQGDYIWFKAYLVLGINHKPILGYKNIYVQLISENGDVHAERIVLSQNGTATGDILLSDTIPDGNYIIRAFTRYLENFGEESFFHQRIYVSAKKSSIGIESDVERKVEAIDIAFLPEGGNLVPNALNHIAFKAIDNKGTGVEVTGSVLDDNDSLVTRFATTYKGMGLMMIMPLEGKKYHVRLDNFPNYSFTFGDFQKDGIHLHYSDEGDEAVFGFNRNFRNTDNEEVWLVGSYKGFILFTQKIELTEISQAIKVKKDIFFPGINKITLLNNSLHEIAERLIFIDNFQEDGLKLNINKNQFSTREEVKLEIELEETPFDSLSPSISVAVVNLNYMDNTNLRQTLNSYLLLDSELKGYIEAPSAYFSDEEGITKAEKIDLLMMVNGWRSYFWDELVERKTIDPAKWVDAGITLSGYVKGLFSKKRVPGSQVVLGPFSNNLLYEATIADNNGQFKFDRLYLRDNEKIFIHAKNNKGKLNTEIVMYPENTFQTVPYKLIPGLLPPMPEVPVRFFRDNYFRQLKFEEYFPDAKTILLGNINIFGKKREQPDGHFRLYGEPDRVYKLTSDDNTYANILDYLSTRSGIVVSGEEISIRGGGPPLILVDGLETIMIDDILKHTSLNQIDRIEILSGPFNMAVFGSRGGNGVIAIYTKIGNGMYEINKYVKGRVGLQVRGFRKPAQFYSPRYTSENIMNPIPDYRPTLFWEPELVLKESLTPIEFFTSDEQGDYLIIVEGINPEGKIYSRTVNFTATRDIVP